MRCKACLIRFSWTRGLWFALVVLTLMSSRSGVNGLHFSDRQGLGNAIGCGVCSGDVASLGKVFHKLQAFFAVHLGVDQVFFPMTHYGDLEQTLGFFVHVIFLTQKGTRVMAMPRRLFVSPK